MDIRQADNRDLQVVMDITRETIEAVYLHYYPKGAVEFFLEHHSEEHIRRDMDAGRIYVAQVDGTTVGTMTLKENEINRFFVHPRYQKKGYGTALMDYAEAVLFQEYEKIQLHASFSGKAMYVSRGYRETAYRMQEVAYGDYLCVDIMEKTKYTILNKRDEHQV